MMIQGFSTRWKGLVLLLLWGTCAIAANDRFVNFESPQIHPIDVSPDASLLAVCNSANGTVDIFSITSGSPVFAFSVPVGIDPASVRFRGNGEAWAVNFVSDSVNIIDLATRSVVRTLLTRDEPSDVVFSPNGRAFVSCSEANTIQVFDLANLSSPPQNLRVTGQNPRALALSADGTQVYAAIFLSGNRSTLLAEDISDNLTHMISDRVVSRGDGPHGGQNPPFNGPGQFIPPLAPDLPPPPATNLIVRQGPDDLWRDDTGADWTRFVSGVDSEGSGRVAGWTLPDYDIAIVQTNTLSITYVPHVMNICAGIAVQPGTGRITVAGTDSINEIRYEPNVKGIFAKSLLAFADPALHVTVSVADLNADHLDYSSSSVPEAMRALSIGSPRAMVWNSAGSVAWVSGLGSDNVVAVDAAGNRTGSGQPIPVGEGPSGLALDESRDRLYVLCRFGAVITAIDTSSGVVTGNTALADPTPEAIRQGRKFLYNTVETSGLGQVSCETCHVDARTDGLAWDLGDPQGTFRSSADRNIFRLVPAADGEDYHPMKGPRTTQTLQDIIGHEPFHWSGDRDGIEAFRGAYASLLGDDAPLDAGSMELLKRFLATITFTPNPNRNLDNSLSENVDFSNLPSAFDDVPAPMPNGNAQRGFELYQAGACMRCHTIPSGRGTPLRLVDDHLEPIVPGPNGERSLRLGVGNAEIQRTYKIPPFAPLYTKMGFDMHSAAGSTAGFGGFASGVLDSLLRFVDLNFDGRHQDTLDFVALLISWGGSEFPRGQLGTTNEPPGLPARDSHAATGAQVTVRGGGNGDARARELAAIVDASDRIELIAKGRRSGLPAGWWYQDGVFLGDTAGETLGMDALLQSAGPGTEITFTVVPGGTGRRLGIDRDLDDIRDADDVAQAPVALDGGDAPGTELNCPECDSNTLDVEEHATLCLHGGQPSSGAFMWSRDGVALAEGKRVQGAFCDRLQLRDISRNEAGTYRLDYFDDDGTPNSETFVVTVQKSHEVPAMYPATALLLCMALSMAFRKNLVRKSPSIPTKA